VATPYGYKQRTDPAARTIGTGQSRITLPNAEETRRTDIVSKTNFGVPQTILSNVDDFYIWPRLTSGVTYIGNNNELLGGATTRWNSDIKRYSKNQTQASAVSAHRFMFGMSPRALVDPLYAPSGIIVKVQDLVRAFFQGATNIQPGKAVLCLGPQAGSSVATVEIATVGWRAVYTNLGLQPTWITQFSSKDGSFVRQIDSGLTCDVPRLLSFILDGKTQTIRWYANGVLVDSFAPSSGQVGGQNSSVGRDSLQYICNCTSGVVAGSSFDYMMLGAPLVTIQFPDA
jgi:hypothetical protein